MTRFVDLTELDRVGREVALSVEEAGALAATGLVEVRPALGGKWLLLPCGKVGAVRTRHLQVQVHPKDKVGLTHLLFLLGYARNPGFRPEDVSAVEQPELWPALAESLARLGERATDTGILQGYRTIDDGLKCVRGRIRLGDQISKRPGRMVPVEVTYDEFTVDIPENQILRAAVRRMLGVPGLSDSALARLAHLDQRLAEVTLLRSGVPLPNWRRSRLNERYQAGLRLAEVILRTMSAEAADGTVQVASFVVNMATVFEDFVGTALRESLRRFPGRTAIQFATHLDEVQPGDKPGIPMKVDVVHLVSGVPRIVFDAKYKAASSDGTYPNADHYQMLAYCTALKVPTAWLVYAGGGKPERRRVRHTDIEIIEYPLNLRAEPRDVLVQVELLARRAWSRGAQMIPVAS